MRGARGWKGTGRRRRRRVDVCVSAAGRHLRRRRDGVCVSLEEAGPSQARCPTLREEERLCPRVRATTEENRPWLCAHVCVPVVVEYNKGGSSSSDYSHHWTHVLSVLRLTSAAWPLKRSYLMTQHSSVYSKTVPAYHWSRCRTRHAAPTGCQNASSLSASGARPPSSSDVAVTARTSGSGADPAVDTAAADDAASSSSDGDPSTTRGVVWALGGAAATGSSLASGAWSPPGSSVTKPRFLSCLRSAREPPSRRYSSTVVAAL
mmetsp:Transcript_18970/g.75648  ORF Transcript_18970/g.75648 Transcript_18970/m.75648 type:complete len:263 (-) Transcript_18970:2576-3364(-)